MSHSDAPAAANLPSLPTNGECGQDDENSENAVPNSPSPDVKPSTSGVMTDVQHMEERIAAKFESLARALEEQNRLLRALVEERVEEKRKTGRADTERNDGEKPSTMHVSTASDFTGERRPTSRLQVMGKASASGEEDLEIERRKALPDKTNGGGLQHMSLAQRKREFIRKTAPGVGDGGGGDVKQGMGKTGNGRDQRGPRESRHSRTRLAVAAAKREMERGKAQRALHRDLEQQQANSVGSWIVFVLLVVLGATSLSLGFFALRQSKRQQQDTSEL